MVSVGYAVFLVVTTIIIGRTNYEAEQREASQMMASFDYSLVTIQEKRSFLRGYYGDKGDYLVIEKLADKTDEEITEIFNRIENVAVKI